MTLPPRENYKVLLLLSNTRWFDKRPWITIPQSALILTALLKNECDFHILDANGKDLSIESTYAYIKDLSPDMVMVSALSVEYHQQHHQAINLARQACPECITVMGGVYPTVMSEDALENENLDYIFIGHAEDRIGAFVQAAASGNVDEIRAMPGIGFHGAEGQPVINPVKTYIGDVKEMVRPDYSLIDMDFYLKQSSKDYQFNSDLPTATLLTSYGCPYNCIFCATRTISGRKVAFRPVEEVLDEIDYLVSYYGVKNLIFLDECFLARRSRVEAILQALIDREDKLVFKIATVSAWNLDDALLEMMRQAGCIQISVSVESGNPRVLHDIIRKPLDLDIIPGIVKKCKELGIDIGANFVIGFPGETWEEIRDTFRYAESQDFDVVHFHIATPLPGTDLYKLAAEQGMLPPDFSFKDPRYFGYGQAFIGTDEFTPQELMVLRAYEYDRINFRTPEKTANIARMMGISLDELKEHRKQTRIKCGIHL